VEELVALADRVDHDAGFTAAYLRRHVERLPAPLPHVLADELHPEARVARPAQPLDRPAVLHVARPRDRPAEADAPTRQDRPAEIADERDLRGRRLGAGRDVAVEEGRALEIDAAQEVGGIGDRRLEVLL